MGILEWDDEFTVAPAENQEALLAFCDYLENESKLVMNNLVECWIKDMNEFVIRHSAGKKSFPIQNENEFTEWLLLFIEKDPAGIQAYRTQKLGFIDVERTAEYPFNAKL